MVRSESTRDHFYQWLEQQLDSVRRIHANSSNTLLECNNNLQAEVSL